MGRLISRICISKKIDHKMDKIIFLDFDGVLNTEHYQNLLYHEGKALQDEYGAYFDPESVE